ncbi:MAG: hypothetical protein KDH96_09275 [Candidatus Riesia sp.]|nr:hypothetical protein [Candidatus Riesia sp.]
MYTEYYTQLLQKYPNSDDYEEALESYNARKSALAEYAQAQGKSLRSVIVSLTRLKLYVPKPVKEKTPNTDLINLLNRYENSPSKEQIERLRECSNKERMLQELEDKLDLERYALYSLKAATKVDLVNLIIGIENYVKRESK